MCAWKHLLSTSCHLLRFVSTLCPPPVDYTDTPHSFLKCALLDFRSLLPSSSERFLPPFPGPALMVVSATSLGVWMTSLRVLLTCLEVVPPNPLAALQRS